MWLFEGESDGASEWRRRDLRQRCGGVVNETSKEQLIGD